MTASVVRRFVTLVIVMLGSVSLPVAAVPLPFPLVPQESSQWCWAAAAEMILRGLGAPAGSFSQRVQADRLLKAGGCPKVLCSPWAETTEACRKPGFPQFYKYKYDAEVTGPLMWVDWEWLVNELECNAIAFAYEKIDARGALIGQGHMVVFASARDVTLEVGGSAFSLGRLIAVNDPQSTHHPKGFSPGVYCLANRKIWTYAHYRKLKPWVHYYGFRPVDQPLRDCHGHGYLADAARWELLTGEPASQEDIAAIGPSEPQEVVETLLNALQVAESSQDSGSDLAWLLAAAGVEDPSAWSCDLSSPLIQESVALSRAELKSVVNLSQYTFETGGLRFLCTDGGHGHFSIEVEQAADQSWNLVSLGDAALAERLSDARDAIGGFGGQLRETDIQGINLLLLREPGLLPSGRERWLNVSPLEGLDDDLWSVGIDRTWWISPEGLPLMLPRFEWMPRTGPMDPWTYPVDPWIDSFDGVLDTVDPQKLLPAIREAAEGSAGVGPS